MNKIQVDSIGRCPYDHTGSFDDAATKPFLLNREAPSRCAYGYVGSFDDAIKPILLIYIVGSAMGSIFLAVLFDDATRPFILATTLHLVPEVFVWTHLIFPPSTSDTNQSALWKIRGMFLMGWLVLCFGPNNAETGKIGPLVAAMYMTMAGISDTLGVWLGLLMMTRRSHHGARRIGVSFFIHGSAFHLTAYEAFCSNNSAFGPSELSGFAWIVLLVSTTAAFFTLLPLFKEPLDLRDQAPTAMEKRFLVVGVLTSLLTVPVLASGGGPPDTAGFLSNPKFLPTDSRVLLAYKIVFPILALITCLLTLLAYVDAGLPILPITHQHVVRAKPSIDTKRAK
jgi:hypothetical protein